LTALATAGQFLVVGAAAVFAYLQLRGLRRQQEAQVVQRIFDELNCKSRRTGIKSHRSVCCVAVSPFLEPSRSGRRTDATPISTCLHAVRILGGARGCGGFRAD
jgi:hypothetical protein